MQNCNKILVYGLGRTGLAAVEFFLQKGYVVYAFDDNATNLNTLTQKLSFNAENLRVMQDVSRDVLLGAGYILLSPGIPIYGNNSSKVVQLATELNVKIVSDVDVLHYYNKSKKYIGVTGTNGKSTTTALIGHILDSCNVSVEVGGNIGIPVLQLSQDVDVYALEMSSFQLDITKSFEFDVSVLTNITPDHLDRYNSFEHYILSKKQILNGGKPKIICVNGVECAKIAGEISDKENVVLVDVSAGNVAKIKYQNHLSRGNDVSEFCLADHKYLIGNHNAQNIACAVAACVEVGVNLETAILAAQSFKGLRHRAQIVRNINGIAFVNDSKATNPDSARFALQSFKNIYWILGGVEKATGPLELQDLFFRVRKAFLIGQAQEKFADILDGKLSYIKCTNLNKAVTEAFLCAKKDIESGAIDSATILLSPCCASFDQYKDYEHRGQHFEECANEVVQ